MDNKKLKSIMQDALEKEISPAQIELWPAVKNHLVARKHPLFQQGEKMNLSQSRRTLRFGRNLHNNRCAVDGGLHLPPGPCSGADHPAVLYPRPERYASGSDRTTVEMGRADNAWHTSTHRNAPAQPHRFCFFRRLRRFSHPEMFHRADSRSQVNFTIKELGTIPERLYFIGALSRPEGVYLLYDTVDHSGAISLRQSPWTGNPEQTAWKVGPSASVETVKINGLPGEYVRGSFTMNDGDPTIFWDGDKDIQTLHWVDQGVFIEMDSTGSVLPMERDSFVSLAETLTTRPISAGSPLLPTPNPEVGKYSGAYPDYILTIAEVGKQAGSTYGSQANYPNPCCSEAQPMTSKTR